MYIYIYVDVNVYKQYCFELKPRKTNRNDNISYNHILGPRQKDCLLLVPQELKHFFGGFQNKLGHLDRNMVEPTSGTTQFFFSGGALFPNLSQHIAFLSTYRRAHVVLTVRL